MMSTNVSAFIITEVELNPEGSDKGTEWVEIYAEVEHTDVSFFHLENSNGDTHPLEGSYSEGDYFVVTFDDFWLSNSEESIKVVLTASGTLASEETPILEDGDNDAKTWMLCDGEWVFAIGTMGGDNDCDDVLDEVEEEDNNEVIIEESLEEETSEVQIESLNSNRPEVNENNPIVLSSKKADETVDSVKHVSKNQNLRNVMVYGFLFFLVVLVILLILIRL